MLADDRKIVRALHEDGRTRSDPRITASTVAATMKANACEKQVPPGALDVERMPGTVPRTESCVARRPILLALKRLLVLALSAWLIVFYIARMPEYAELANAVDSLLGTHDNNECPQAPALAPSLHTDVLTKLEHEYESQRFRLQAYESLGGAVRIP